MILDFISHLFPRWIRVSDSKVTYTFCLGGLAFTFLLVLLASGGLLLFHYQPAPERAYDSIMFLESSVSGGRWLRSIHRLASHFLIVLLLLHTCRVFLTGAFRKPRELNWMIGAGLFILVLCEAYFGYLLPMNQQGYWAAVTGMELLRSIPFIGNTLADIWVPDQVGSATSLMRFYVMHIMIVPLGLLALSFFHFYLVRKNNGVLPYL